MSRRLLSDGSSATLRASPAIRQARVAHRIIFRRGQPAVPRRPQGERTVTGPIALEIFTDYV